jgi:sulfite reductase (NADPH) flavoprotein alpha-component
MKMERAGGAAPYAALIPDDAPFSPEQRAWLSGFLMALLAPPEQPAEAAAPALSIAVLYASQTGTAEGLARKWARAAKGRGFDATARDIGGLSLADLAGLDHAIIIAATHGEGEPPDSALRLTAELDAAAGAPLAGLKYAVLALGDSSYLKFCGYGRQLDERLAALGAVRLAERVEVDGDTAGPFAAWRDRAIEVFAREAGASPTQAGEAAASEDEPAEAPGTRNNPFAAPLIENRPLTATGSDKDVRHIALSLADAPFAYEPGDALGTWPTNPPEMVDAILRATGCDGDAPVDVDGAMPLAEALARRLSIGRLTQPTLIRFAKAANDPELAALLEPERADDLAAFLYGRDVIDLFLRYPGAVATPEALAAVLPRLAPRVYSISSSLKAHPGEVHLTVAVVKYRSLDRARVGIGSTFLAERAGAGPVGVYLQANKRFRLPADPKTPIVMIGPGTGIAPFRAFLEERRAVGGAGPAWLFFGDRHAATDFLYREELAQFQNDGVLSRLDLAFSRDQAEKVYVQNRMMENAAELWRWIKDGAHLYVCGDASRMAKDVHAALKTIVARQGRLSEAQATLEVDQLAATGRYARDVY